MKYPLKYGGIFYALDIPYRSAVLYCIKLFADLSKKDRLVIAAELAIKTAFNPKIASVALFSVA